MKFNLRAIAEIIAVLSVVLSLLFVGYELQLNRSVASNESYASSVEIETTIREYVSQHPSVLYRGCLNEELTQDEDVIFANLVRAIDRLGFFRYLRASQGISGATAETHATVVAQNRVVFEGFNRKWLEIREFGLGSEAWYLLVEETYAEMKSQDVWPSQNATLCGF